MGFVRYVTLLWHGDEPIGICVFASPALALRSRHRYFGMSGKWSRTKMRVLNGQLVTLSRVVLHPAYRGAGLVAPFIRRSCESCRWRWVEALAQMGHMNPFFEKAGFVRVGGRVQCPRERKSGSIKGHSAIYGGRFQKHGKQRLVSKETHEKSRYSQPVYYIFDNRQSERGRKPEDGQ